MNNKRRNLLHSKDLSVGSYAFPTRAFVSADFANTALAHNDDSPHPHSLAPAVRDSLSFFLCTLRFFLVFFPGSSRPERVIHPFS
jgi:hypothetical protein